MKIVYLFFLKLILVNELLAFDEVTINFKNSKNFDAEYFNVYYKVLNPTNNAFFSTANPIKLKKINNRFQSIEFYVINNKFKKDIEFNRCDCQYTPDGTKENITLELSTQHCDFCLCFCICFCTFSLTINEIPFII